MINNLNLYLKTLNSIKDGPSIKLSTILEILDDFSFQQIKSDFSTVGIEITEKSFNLEDAKWKIRQYLSLHKKEDLLIKIESNSDKQIKNVTKEFNDGSVMDAIICDKAFNYTLNNPEDILFSLSLLPDDLIAYKHQIQTVQNVINNYNSRAIVADEVGLGKTITALLWLHEHILRSGRIINTIILVPSNLMKQWCDAFFDFFRLTFSKKKKYSVNELESQDILLMSLDQAKIGDNARILLKRHWDCFILDESHDIKNSESIRFKFVYSLNATYKLFLSATPVHNSAYDLHSQSLPIYPGLLDKAKQFGSYYLEDDKRVINPEGLQKILQKIIIRTRREDIPFKFSERKPHTEFITEWTEHEYSIYNDLLFILIGVFHKHLPKAIILAKQAGSEVAVADFVLKCMLLLREMASHPDAALKTIEDSLYPNILEYATAINDYTYTKMIDNFIKKYKNNEHHLSKEQYLLKILKQLLDNKSRRIIIFVNFLKTRDAIEKTINKNFPKVKTYLYYGKLPKPDKERNIESFINSDSAILISTDSGGQGLNLDAADVVINYDYPWNPMKVEQRIGRIDRLGKRYNQIYIYNLITSGTIEQYVYQTLIEKINIVKDIFGDIMSPIEVKEEWERRFMVSIGLIVLSCNNSTELKEKFEKLDKTTLNRAATQYKTLIFDRYKYGLE
ncbi:MAG: DEAD/DEAH box helicase [Spirochaetes bacterium]|nr:DEAD/DEAH box helicase [Spirochaetota bacterium]